MSYPKLLDDLIEQLIKLPGVGRRSAERMAFWFLAHSREEVTVMADTMRQLKEELRFCRKCNHLTQAEFCSICTNVKRDPSIICVVEDPKDLIAIEKSGCFKGLYHVLLGSISPADGRGPDDLKIRHLIERIKTEKPKEVVIATDADNEGEMTALYLSEQLAGLDVTVSRIGLGLPMGSTVEFVDISTLAASLNSRRQITSL